MRHHLAMESGGVGAPKSRKRTTYRTARLPFVIAGGLSAFGMEGSRGKGR